MEHKKTVVVGVTGGIAAYKSCELVSRLIKKNINTVVVMTKSATEFVSPLTFMTISKNKVITKMFDTPASFDVEHISVAKQADLFVIVPATANIIGKIANGIADDFLSTTVMATKAPVLIAPAMNTNMWQNPIVQKNVSTLKEYGYTFVNPAKGRLACGDVGEGKLADLDDIEQAIEIALCNNKDLLGKKVLVTAGATMEHIDPVRYITNPSSGKMGLCVAKAARNRGADVTLIAGNTEFKDLYGVEVVKVSSALEMEKEVLSRFKECDIVVKSAAVGDYRAKNVAQNKIKKTSDELNVELVKNPDILKGLGNKKENQILVGFCMETENLEQNALKKLEDKNLDMIVANSLMAEGAGFKSDTNIVTIYTKNKEKTQLPLMSKEDVSNVIFDKVLEL
ncbi:MAG: bifunctional phosphopantothenoylcysteine decarboxylase/phosphopantothenate--cysteine ligase CoaBC [Clostridia bacterium]|nr:bifunctional phosphopantothenoylcysteine decarboxylase/phosphopantothenate--cysteine ligase CoaBC [Clostridia bacterium]